MSLLVAGLGTLLYVGFKSQEQLNQPRYQPKILPKIPYIDMKTYATTNGATLPWKGRGYNTNAIYGIPKETWQHPNGSKVITRGHNPAIVQK